MAQIFRLIWIKIEHLTNMLSREKLHMYIYCLDSWNYNSQAEWEAYPWCRWFVMIFMQSAFSPRSFYVFQ